MIVAGGDFEVLADFLESDGLHFYINVQHDKEIELVMIDQFSVCIQS